MVKIYAAGIQTSFAVVIFYVFTDWWIANEFEKLNDFPKLL